MASNSQQFQEQVLACLEEQVDITQKCKKILSNSLTAIHETVLVLPRTQETLFNLQQRLQF